MGVLDGKIALITGAGRGFGLAIAERFAEEGADLALHYRASRDACEAIVARVRDAGRRAVALQADLTDAGAIEAMVVRALDELGRIDILVNNAGVLYRGPFVESPEGEWQADIAVNVFGTLRVTKAVLPHMIARQSGRIVNLSSQLAPGGSAGSAVYAGSKAFVLTWSKSLAREVGPYNINVNVIGPGSIVTDMNKDLYPTPEAEAERAASLPLQRMGSPRDVAECALFLASDAGNFMTGQMLVTNGGAVI
jgi:3-oxoacyl-[acyl-carrier protein] reductase